MDKYEILKILKNIENGSMTAEEAVKHLKLLAFEDIGYAKVDHHRAVRQGTPEVIYGKSKTPEQILGILDAMRKNGTNNILITRMSSEAARLVGLHHPLDYDELSQIGIPAHEPFKDPVGQIVIVSGGTSDMSVCEEAALTAEVFGNNVKRLYDVGVSGLHRLLENLDTLVSANVVIAVAGMEGALAGVVGGLVDCPVIAVPTSIGYGANFGGLSALLSMLNSCASGVSVVNIDNGFGAGYLASMINKMGVKQ